MSVGLVIWSTNNPIDLKIGISSPNHPALIYLFILSFMFVNMDFLFPWGEMRDYVDNEPILWCRKVWVINPTHEVEKLWTIIPICEVERSVSCKPNPWCWEKCEPWVQFVLSYSIVMRNLGKKPMSCRIVGRALWLRFRTCFSPIFLALWWCDL